MKDQYSIARFVYLRVLGLCLVCGFLSLLEQAPGLIGEHGISPLGDIMAQWRRASDAPFWPAPSLFWLSTADGFVAAVAGLGCAAAALLVLGVAPRLAAIVAFVCWLSFRAVDGGSVRWFNFPADDMQTELAFLGVLVAPGVLWPWQRPRPLPRWVRWLALWAAFRLLFGPGLAKVLYHAPWRDLSAIGEFLVAMPHPTALAAWFADLGSPWLETMSAFTLVCELGCPFLLFVPGRTRRLAAALCIALMIGIQLVCNIRAFQLMTSALLLLTWDDDALRRLLPWSRSRGDRDIAAVDLAAVEAAPAVASPWRRAVAASMFALVVTASLRPAGAGFGLSPAALSPTVDAALRRLEPFHLASGYTMFCVLPNTRFGLVVQGSDDGESWRDYEPWHVPARVDRAPSFFAPCADYLGFRLWLAAFAPPTQDGWLRTLQQRLLDGEPAVLALFREVPFAAPPRYVRLVMMRFEFAGPATRAVGTFWRREQVLVRVPAAQRG